MADADEPDDLPSDGNGDESNRPSEDIPVPGECELSDDEEEVTIRVDNEGNVAAMCDQVSNYTLRPRQLDTLCLWDFVAMAEKVDGVGRTTAMSIANQSDSFPWPPLPSKYFQEDDRPWETPPMGSPPPDTHPDGRTIVHMFVLV